MARVIMFSLREWVRDGLHGLRVSNQLLKLVESGFEVVFGDYEFALGFFSDVKQIGLQTPKCFKERLRKVFGALFPLFGVNPCLLELLLKRCNHFVTFIWLHRLMVGDLLALRDGLALALLGGLAATV